MNLSRKKRYVLIIPDGAGDVHRISGASPLAAAQTSYMDFIACEGVTGLMQTQYEDLPKGSVVAQLGMLGWDPYQHFPHGRSSCELLALNGLTLGADDLAFRANMVLMDGRTLASYNADCILSEQAVPLIEKINESLGAKFPDFELYHHNDFRNTLVIRGAKVDPRLLLCPEPHESHGMEFEVEHLISGLDAESQAVAAKINQYLVLVAELLRFEKANMLFLWSPSKAFQLPSFKQHMRFDGQVGIVGYMDFLHGIAKAGGIDFFRVGNGRPDTDYEGKGAKVIELLSLGYEFVVCHINAPDEASHMGDLQMKLKTLELIDYHVVRPTVEYFQSNSEQLGGVMIAPDHYSNISAHVNQLNRTEAHSIHPVPFARWNGYERDAVRNYNEDDVVAGKYGREPVSHLDLLRILGVNRWSKMRVHKTC